jgi:hypothetical protein
MELHKINFTNWDGKSASELHVPKSCHMKFKEEIFDFLFQFNDYDAVDQALKIWGYKNYHEFEENLKTYNKGERG